MKFWANVHFGPTCWEWMGWKDKDGYGRPRVNGTRMPAHRAAWIKEHGAIQDGQIVCHRCDNPSCVRPDHLFLGTHRDNALDRNSKRRGFNQRATHCPRGHEYSAENTRFCGNSRVCRECGRQDVRRRNAEARA